MHGAGRSHLNCGKRYTVHAKFYSIQRPASWCRVGVLCVVAEEWLEVWMPMSRRETRGGRAFAFPLFGIVVLLAAYWLIADWQEVPGIVNAALAVVHWPR
jgi:hypothetical protein